MNPAIRASLLNQLVNDWGMRDLYDLMETYGFDSVVPGICECGYSTEVEPDSNGGWCEECNKNTVVSFMVLMGVI